MEAIQSLTTKLSATTSCLYVATAQHCFPAMMRMEYNTLEDSPTSQATLEFNASSVLFAAYLQSMSSHVCLAMCPSWHQCNARHKDCTSLWQEGDTPLILFTCHSLLEYPR